MDYNSEVGQDLFRFVFSGDSIITKENNFFGSLKRQELYQTGLRENNHTVYLHNSE